MNDLSPLDLMIKNSVSDYNSPLSLEASEEGKRPLQSRMRICLKDLVPDALSESNANNGANAIDVN